MEAREVKKLAHGTGVTFLGGVAGNGLNYAAGVVLARLVGAERIGVYFLCLAWINLASIVGRLGLADALLRFIPPARVAGNEDEANGVAAAVLRLGLLASLVVACGLAIVAPLSERAFGVDPTFASYLFWFAWTLPLHVLFVLLMMVIQAWQRMNPVVAIRDILQPTALALVTLALVHVFGAQPGLIGGFAASLLLAVALALIWIARNAVRIGGRGVGRRIVPLLGYALPIMGSDLSHYLFRWLDTFAVGYFLGMTEVGIYNAALRTSLVIALVVMAANAIYATMASGFFHTGQPEKLQKALDLSTRWCLILAAPMIVTFLVGGDWIMGIWGAEFASGHRVLAALSLAQGIGIVGGILAYTLVMCNRQYLELANTLVLLALLLALNVLWIPRVGALGASLAVLTAQSVGVVVRAWQVRHRLGLLSVRGHLWKPLLAGLVTLAACAGLRHLAGGGRLASGAAGLPELLAALAVLGLTASAVFLGVYRLFGFEQDDRDLIDSVLRRRHA